MRQFIAAAVVMFVFAGVAMSDTVRGVITSMEGNKAKVRVFEKGKKGGEEKEFTVAADAKFFKGTPSFDKETKKFEMKKEDATKADFSKAMEAATKGLGVTLEVDGTTIKEIIFMAGKKGKKKKDAE